VGSFSSWRERVSQVQIAEKLGVPRKTVNDWLANREQTSEIATPPESRQHFDMWQFATADKDSGSQFLD
jgi:DNA-binding transcriptional regulator LsrR (DeoR family)